MPRRELKSGKHVADWLAEVGSQLKAPGNMTLIGSAALLGHAHERGITTELPEASMDVDPVTDSEEVAMHCYEALIGSEFLPTAGTSNCCPSPFCGNYPPVESNARRQSKSAN
jgi:hypothetical protein